MKTYKKYFKAIFFFVNFCLFDLATIYGKDFSNATLQLDKVLEEFSTAELVVKKNMCMTVDTYSWIYRTDDQGAMLDFLNADFQSAKSGKNVEEEILRHFQNRLGKTVSSHWNITFYQGTIKFQKSFDEETIAEIKKAGMRANTKFQWLYTDTTLYEYFFDENRLIIRPFDPETTPYPFQLDVFNMLFGPLSADVIAATPSMTLTSIQDGKITLQPRPGADVPTKVQLNVDNNVLSPLSMAIHSIKDDRRLLRIYAGSLTIPNTSVGMSRIAASIVQANKALLVDLYLVKDMKFGDVTPDEMKISALPTTRIDDQEIPRKEK